MRAKPVRRDLPPHPHRRCGRRLRGLHAGPLRDPDLRDPDRRFHPPVLSADRDHERRTGALRRRVLHRRLDDLRHRPLDRRHGDLLVALRPRDRLPRSGDRRHRGADPGVDPRPRDQPQARTAPEAHRRERRQPDAHPTWTRLGGPGRAARRDRQPAAHRRHQRAGHRGRHRRAAVPPDADPERRSLVGGLGVGLSVGHGVHQHRVHPDERGPRAFRRAIPTSSSS